jgi:hypothetical protein
MAEIKKKKEEEPTAREKKIRLVVSEMTPKEKSRLWQLTMGNPASGNTPLFRLIRSFLPERPAVPETCEHITRNGENCSRAFNYYDAYPRFPDYTRSVDCTDYCWKNCDKWIHHLVTRLPTAVQFESPWGYTLTPAEAVEKHPVVKAIISLSRPIKVSASETFMGRGLMSRALMAPGIQREELLLVHDATLETWFSTKDFIFAEAIGTTQRHPALLEGLYKNWIDKGTEQSSKQESKIESKLGMTPFEDKQLLKDLYEKDYNNSGFAAEEKLHAIDEKTARLKLSTFCSNLQKQGYKDYFYGEGGGDVDLYIRTPLLVHFAFYVRWRRPDYLQGTQLEPYRIQSFYPYERYFRRHTRYSNWDVSKTGGRYPNEYFRVAGNEEYE